MIDQQQPGELTGRRLVAQTGARARLNGMIWVMSERDDFLTWVNTSLYGAELALHNGDARPRRALWSRREARERPRGVAKRLWTGGAR